MGACFSKGRRRRPSPPSDDHVVGPVLAIWSDLPPEVGGLILRRLLSHVDRCSFAAVCRQWRLAAPRQSGRRLPPALPWLCWTMSPSIADCPDRCKLLPRGIMDAAAAAAGEVAVGPPDLRAIFFSLDGWILFEFYGACTPRVLLDASSGGATMVPPRRRHLDDADGGGGGADPVSATSLKCTMSSSPSRLYRRRHRHGHGPPLWSHDGLLPPHEYEYYPTHGPRCEDVAFHRGKLYAVTGNDGLFAVDLTAGESQADQHDDVIITKATKSSLSPWRMMTTSHVERSGEMRYLVSSGEKLLMVKWSVVPDDFLHVSSRKGTTMAAKVIERMKMKVLEADLEMGRWIEVNSLGDDRALFVSRGCSRALDRLTCSSGKQRFQGNRVYFLGTDAVKCCKEALYPMHEDLRGGVPSYGFYDLRSRTSSAMFIDGAKDIEVSSAARFTPEWFFPCPHG